mgnify:FL=1
MQANTKTTNTERRARTTERTSRRTQTPNHEHTYAKRQNELRILSHKRTSVEPREERVGEERGRTRKPPKKMRKMKINEDQDEELSNKKWR